MKELSQVLYQVKSQQIFALVLTLKPKYSMINFTDLLNLKNCFFQRNTQRDGTQRVPQKRRVRRTTQLLYLSMQKYTTKVGGLILIQSMLVSNTSGTQNTTVIKLFLVVQQHKQIGP